MKALGRKGIVVSVLVGSLVACAGNSTANAAEPVGAQGSEAASVG